jgi:DNA mismatch repair protein MutS2
MRERDLFSLDFPRIREILASFTQTPLGREKALALMPFPNREEAEKEFSRLERLKDASYSLSGIEDIRGILIPLKEGMTLSPQSLLTIRTTIASLMELRKIPDDLGLNGLKNLLSQGEELAKKIGAVIDDFGEIKLDSSPLLRGKIERQRNLRNLLIKRLEGIRKENPELFWQEEVTIRNGRYCLPLKSSKKGIFPGIVHDLSESEKTLFVEPLPLIDLGNQLVRLEREIEEEKRRILSELTNEVVGKREILLSLLDFAAIIDLLQAKISFARAFRGTRPIFTDNNSLEIIGARHPLLLLKGEENKEVVPLDLKMVDKKVLVVSGPNAGGKTCLLKTVGLISLLSQCGIFPPADWVMIPFFDNIFTDIGESESIEESLSAFTAHLLNIKEILENSSDKRSLILLDEIGGSTSPEEGGALACALIEALKERDGITIVTTHLTLVKFFAYNHPEIMQGGMEFKGRPTYRFLPGLFGESSALEIAALLQFPERILKRAESFREEKFVSFSSKIKELEKEIGEYQRLNQRLKEKEKEIEEKGSLLEKRWREWEKEEKRLRREMIREKEIFLKESREKLTKVLTEFRRLQEKTFPDKKIEKKLMTRSEELLTELRAEIEKDREKLRRDRREAKVGDWVRILRFEKEGEVLEIDGEWAKVLVGRLPIKVLRKELEVMEGEGKNLPNQLRIDRETLPPFSPILNIRGEEKVFALEKVERFLEDALFYGCKEVKLLHGKGEGILRKAIWELLGKDKRISGFREGRPEEGGSGVTIVELK